ncbi:mitochondrial tRNA-specific 2-thiouridylase 1 [Anabrus simplex]|uniref:mitochondrial tRNA-specific 2-thiouridylase 1 n=1 Tax=Anabrus simplex TaxID=316456 RepID=UPI0035A2FD05
MNIRRVVVGVSGGVDSAVATFLLKCKGYEVIGAFMRNWDLNDENGLCNSTQDAQDANWICDRLGIHLHYVNFVKEYWHDVFSYLIKDYETGYTPNPDIMCNKKIKFNSFFKYARENLGADAIATGHYARTSFGEYLSDYKPSRGVRLLKPVDVLKDQTFFLSQVNQEPLLRTIFPLGNLTKNYVKDIAHHAGLDYIVKKKESMGICFIGSRHFQAFISEYIGAQPGVFIDLDDGRVVGEHDGIHHWTVGQRCRIGGVVKPYFVAKKEPTTHNIYVASGTNHPALFTEYFEASDVHWIHSQPKSLVNDGILTCEFRFQHTKPLTKCQIVNLSDGRILVKLGLPLRAITPGQYAVFYLGQECLGSARITNPGPSLFSLGKSVQEEYRLYS